MAPVKHLALPFGPSMQGELFSYAQGRVAFESSSNSNSNSVNKCILLGGLSDGLLPMPYSSPLAQALCGAETETSQQWSLVQPILSSSYTGFGHGSLDQDVAELDELIDYLVTYRGAEATALVGHSTGCQVTVHYLKHGCKRDTVQLAALQAPVSDRESATICHGSDDSPEDHLQQLQEHMQIASTLRDTGKAAEMMPRSAFWAPITASRFLDLFEPGGNDDYFSSDYTDAELSERLSHVGGLTTKASSLKHCLVAWSGADEYVPASVDGEALMHRLCRAMNTNNAAADSDSGKKGVTTATAIPLFLPTGNHNLSSAAGADAATFVDKVRELLQNCSATK